LHEIADEFAGILQPAKMLQFEFADIPPQQDLVVDIVEGLHLGIRDAQNLFETKRMEGAEPHACGAFADSVHHAVLHLVRGLVGKRQAENIFARQVGICFEQSSDALDDDPRLAGTGAGHDEKGALAVVHGGLLRAIQFPRRGRIFFCAHWGVWCLGMIPDSRLAKRKRTFS
jgi:hypothetical protein